MALSITINISGTQEELNKLAKLKGGLRDFTTAMRTVGDLMVKYYAGKGYASQGGVFGVVWPSLNPVYARRKAISYPGRGILEASGTMKRSFDATSTSDSVSVTNTAPYAIYHQSTEPRTKMPYRPIMRINDDVKDIVRAVLQQDIQKKLGEL